jgi:hypothetical protein
MICKDEKCNSKHQGHQLKRYNEHKENMSSVETHIKMRDQLAQTMERYKQNITVYVHKLIE